MMLFPKRVAHSKLAVLLVAASGTIAGLGASARAQVIDATWNTAASGDWSVPANWSTNPVFPTNDIPNSLFYRAVVSPTGTAYTITVAQAIALHSMVISSTNARVQLNAGSSMQTTNGISISAGRLGLNGGTLSGSVAHIGTGRIQLFSSPLSVMDGVQITGAWSTSDATGTARVRNGLSVTGSLLLSGSSLSFVFEGDQSLSAALISLGGSTVNPVRLDIDGASTLTIPSQLTGFGTIGAQRYATGPNRLVNNGTITATNANGPLRIKTSSLINNGTLAATNSARLIIENPSGLVNNGQISLTSGRLQLVSPNIILPTFGTLNADAASSIELIGTLAGQTLDSNTSPVGWTLAGATISGSTLHGVGGVPFYLAQDSTFRPGNTLFENVTLDNAEIRQAPSSSGVTISGTLTINGVSSINSLAGISLIGDPHLAGGELRISNTQLTGSGSLTVDPGATLTAAGGNLWLQGPSLVNDGTVRLQNFGRIQLVGSTFHNRAGNIDVEGGSTLDIGTTTYQNTGSITMRSGSTVQVSASSLVGGLGTFIREPNTNIVLTRMLDLGGGSISLTDLAPITLQNAGFANGTVNVAGDFSLFYTTGTIRDCTINGTFRISPIETQPNFTLAGTIGINGEMIFVGTSPRVVVDAMNLTSGTIRLEDEALLLGTTGPSTIGAAAVVAGDGGFSADSNISSGMLINQGTVRADVPGQTMGFSASRVQNDGVLEALEGSTIWVSSMLGSELNGTVRIRNGTFQIGQNITLGPSLTIDRQGGAVEVRALLDLVGGTRVLDGPGESWRVLRSSGLTNGTLELINGATLDLIHEANTSLASISLDDMTVRGNLEVPDRVALIGIDRLRVEGTITLVGASQFSMSATSPATTCRLEAAHLRLGDRALVVIGAPRVIIAPDVQIGATPTYSLSASSASSIGQANINATIENQGRIYCDTLDKAVNISVGTFINTGLVEATNGGHAYIMGNASTTTWSNAGGILRAGPGSELITSGTVLTSNLGTIDTAAGRWVLASANMNNTGATLTLGQTTTGPLYVLGDSTINGGTLSAPGWTGLVVQQSFVRLNNLTANTNILVLPSMGMSLSGTVTVNGVVTLNPNSGISGASQGSTVTVGAGEFVLNGTPAQPTIMGGVGFQSLSTFTLGPLVNIHGGAGRIFSGTLSRTILQGTITAEVPGAPISINTINFDHQGTLQAINGGTLNFVYAPNLEATPANFDARGTLKSDSDSFISSTGWIHCAATTTLAYDLNEPLANHTIITAAGDFQANGTLRVRLKSGYAPAAGDSWRLFSGSSVGGQFTTLDLEQLPSSLAWDLSQLATGIIAIESNCPWLTNGCYADYNHDGGIDGDDVMAFFADWDASNICADADASEGVDGDDAIAFFLSWDSSGIGFPGCE